MTNIIGDIAGRYDELIELVDQMPEGEVISVGDMVDRGPNSRAVLDFFMAPGRRAILGNHEHMMLDYYREGGYYSPGVWFGNGGFKTMGNFEDYEVPEKYLAWLESLPLYIEIGDTLITHAFLRNMHDDQALEYGCDLGKSIYDSGGAAECTVLWNRSRPTQKKRWALQVTGHNAQYGLRYWKDDEDKVFAICLDDSGNDKLTGLHLESMKVFQVDYRK